MTKPSKKNRDGQRSSSSKKKKFDDKQRGDKLKMTPGPLGIKRAKMMMGGSERKGFLIIAMIAKIKLFQ
jgi:hypothetical protein